MFAPIVMGALGKVKKEKNLQPQDLASLLSRETESVEKTAPGLKSGGLAALLDMDGDGDIADFLAKLGSGFLSRLGQ